MEPTFRLGLIKIMRVEALGHGIDFSILEDSGIEQACSILLSLLPHTEFELSTVVAISHTHHFVCHLGSFPDRLLGSFAPAVLLAKGTGEQGIITIHGLQKLMLFFGLSQLFGLIC